MGDGNVRLSDGAARRAAARQEQLTWKARWRRRLMGVAAFFVVIALWLVRAVKRIATGLGISGKFVWNGTPAAIRATLEFVAACLGLGALCVMTYWETNNSGLGWKLIFISWGPVAWLAGVAICAWYMWSNRQAQEHYRAGRAAKERRGAAEALRNKALADGDPVAAGAAGQLIDIEDKAVKAQYTRARRWFVQAVMCAIVTVMGVFSNLVSHASMDANKATEVEEDRTAARQVVRRLEREKAALPKPAGVEADKETLAGYVAEASGWGMKDLDPETTCKTDLPHKRMRELCNLAVTVRADLKDAGADEAALAAKEADIQKAQKAVDDLQPLAGAQHYQRIAELINSFPSMPKDTPVTASAVQTWGIFLICIIGLFVTAMGWDSFGERIEKNKAKSGV